MSIVLAGREPKTVDWKLVRDIAILYAVMVAYAMLYQYYFSSLLLFHNDSMRYDSGRLSDYTLTELLTPLAILPIGVRLRCAGQFIAGLLAVFIFIPLPLIFLSQLPSPQYWRDYSYLWIAFLTISAASNWTLPISAVCMSEPTFNRVLAAIFFVFALVLALSARNGLSFASFDTAGLARQDVKLGPLGGYALYMFTGAFGGLAICLTLLRKSWILLTLTLLTFVLCYAIMSIKTALLAPVWVFYFYFAQRYALRDSTARYFALLIFPFGILVALAGFFSIERGTITYDVLTLVSYRLYTIPSAGFSFYFNFFQTHPVTEWSHINVLGLFLHYPYATDLGAVMEDAYSFGNYNTNFLASDGIAGAGIAGVPIVAAVVGLTLVGINTAYNGVSSIFVATTMALPAMVLIDSPLSTALLTSGLGPLAILVFFMPRHISARAPG